MLMKKHTCCFTGHRPQSLPWGYNEDVPECVQLKKRLYDEIESAVKNEYSHFIFGAALGADTYAAEQVLLLKKKYKHITLEAAIPCPSQSARWTSASKERYERILALCDKKTLISPSYTYACMHERNRYMVDNSSLLIAIYNGGPGGTANTVDYAERQGLDIKLVRWM